MNVGNRILTLRKEKGYSRKKLSEESKVSESAIKQYETGKRQPKLEQLQLIANSLGVPLYELMGIPKAEIIDPDDPRYIDVIRADPREQMLVRFDALNPDGQTRAVEAVGELTEIPRYRKDQKDGDPE